MAQPTDITLAVGTTFGRTITKPTSSVWRDSSRDITLPLTLTIAHETSGNGRVSSVILLEDSKSAIAPADPATPNFSNVKAQFKIQYNIVEGRDDIEATLVALKANLLAALNDATIWDKFINKEA